MAERDEKGYIRYSMEELQRIPPYEERVRGTNPAMMGITGGTAGTLAGAAIGSSFGPTGTIVGGVGGALAGGAAGRYFNRLGEK